MFKMNILSMLNTDHLSVSQRGNVSNHTSLQTFPAETLDGILELLPKDALANLRLTSRFYDQRAKFYLFRQLTIRDSIASVARVSEIFKDYSLASLVREFSFKAQHPAATRVIQADCLQNGVVKAYHSTLVP